MLGHGFLNRARPVATLSECEWEKNLELVSWMLHRGNKNEPRHEVRVHTRATIEGEKSHDHLTGHWRLRLLAARPSAGEQTLHSVLSTTRSSFWGADAVITWHRAGGNYAFRGAFSLTFKTVLIGLCLINQILTPHSIVNGKLQHF